MPTLIERLLSDAKIMRDIAAESVSPSRDCRFDDARLSEEAAQRIEKLEAALRRIASETDEMSINAIASAALDENPQG